MSNFGSLPGIAGGLPRIIMYGVPGILTKPRKLSNYYNCNDFVKNRLGKTFQAPGYSDILNPFLYQRITVSGFTTMRKLFRSFRNLDKNTRKTRSMSLIFGRFVFFIMQTADIKQGSQAEDFCHWSPTKYRRKLLKL